LTWPNDGEVFGKRLRRAIMRWELIAGFRIALPSAAVVTLISLLL
jgi:hypothetical protein